MKRVFIIYLIVSMTGLSPARENGKRVFNRQDVGIQFGTALASRRDDLLVPLGFHGPGVSFGRFPSVTSRTAC